MTLFGFLVGILVPAIVNAAGIKLTQPEFTFAAIIGVVSVCASLITLWSCKSHITFIPAPSDQSQLDIKTLLRGKLGLLMLAFFVATFAQGLNSVLAMYYYRFSLGLDDQAVGKILVVFVLSLCLTIPFWVTAANRYSKAHLIAFGTIGLGFMGSALYPIFPANQLRFLRSASKEGF